MNRNSMSICVLLALLTLGPSCTSTRTTHAQRMATVVSETREDVDRLGARFQMLRARLAAATPTEAAARELGPRVDGLVARVDGALRTADRELEVALSETSHEHFVAAQDSVQSARRGVQELEQLASAMGAPDTVTAN